MKSRLRKEGWVGISQVARGVLSFCDCCFCSRGCRIIFLAFSICPLVDEAEPCASFLMGGTD